METIDAFLPSHQMAVTQLALTSCSELVENNPGFFAGFDFDQSARSAFGPVAPGLPDANQQANRNQGNAPLSDAQPEQPAGQPGRQEIGDRVEQRKEAEEQQA